MPIRDAEPDLGGPGSRLLHHCAIQPLTNILVSMIAHKAATIIKNPTRLRLLRSGLIREGKSNDNQ
jgi:hypothetical protein